MKANTPVWTVLVCLAAACGGGPGQQTDYNPNFTGTWRGSLTMTMAGSTATVQGIQVVTAVSMNRFRFEDPYCPMTLTAASATQAFVDATDCPNYGSPPGCTYRVRITSGSFVREGNGARFTASGTANIVSGCALPPGTSVPYSLNSDVWTRQ